MATTIQVVVNPQITEHTVSHEVLLDKKCWEAKLGSGRRRSTFSAMAECGLDFKPFTADDDGDVFWEICISNTMHNYFEYKVELSMEPKTEDILCVLAWAKLQTDLGQPFSEKNGTYQLVMKPNNRTVLKFDEYLSEGFENFRIDLTYAKCFKQDSLTVTDNQAKIASTIDQKESLVSGVAALFENPVASDVTIRCNDQEWKLHKTILAAQSKMFAAMFSTDMKENSEGVVEIKNVKSETLDLMFKFLYNVEIFDTQLQDVAEDLLILADMYDVPALKKRCQKLLISQLRMENCLRLFILAHKYDSKLLLTSAKIAVVRHLPKICKTDEYKVFVRENLELSIELVTLLAARKCDCEPW